jgi:hypothetical protein
VDRKDKMFLLHFGAPEGSDVPSPLRCTGRIRCSFSVEKEHLILPVHLIGDETYYPSGAPKWRRNILSFRCTELEKEHISFST